MKRSGRIPRYTRLQSSGPLRPKKRSAKASTRIYGTPAHQDWLRAMPCLGCSRIGTEDRPHHLHHTKNGGTGRKADAADQVPLCHDCHETVHRLGVTSFERSYAPMLCHRTLRQWAATYADAWTKWNSHEEDQDAEGSSREGGECGGVTPPHRDDESGLGMGRAARPSVGDGAGSSANDSPRGERSGRVASSPESET